MFKIRLQNFRSFSDTSEIDIRPITVFVGKNGSGKSSITRFFPLLRQSAETRSAAPLIWYGDYVDFGSISDVKCKFCGDEPIRIGFRFRPRDIAAPAFRPFALPTFLRNVESIHYEAEFIEVDEKTEISKFLLDIDGDSVEVALTAGKASIEKISINGSDVTDKIKKEHVIIGRGTIIPTIHVPTIHRTLKNTSTYFPNTFPDAYTHLVGFYRRWLHGNVRDETIYQLLDAVRYSPEPNFYANLIKAPVSMESWRNLLNYLDQSWNQSVRSSLRSLHLLHDLPGIVFETDKQLRDLFGLINYIRPTRATSQRYYRIQEVAVDQIDPDGSNFAMYLFSLTRREREAFSEWARSFLEHDVYPDRSGGHVQVVLSDAVGRGNFNLADMGYGYSQVLPVLAQIWTQRRRRPGRGGMRLLAIEQPELHLHPAMQAGLAKMFARAIYTTAPRQEPQRRPSGLHLIVETHSEQLINQLAELVYLKEISPEDVIIYIFEKGGDDPFTRVKPSTISESGTLENWPYGFFTG